MIVLGNILAIPESLDFCACILEAYIPSAFTTAFTHF